ncbi:MAG: TolC family protein [Saprospiraceae bacterium]|nr:TolC family protein [Saprospiraceae bacterium]
MNRWSAFILVIIFFPVLIQAQEKWTLEQCIQHAVENNLAIKQSDIQVQSNQYNYEAAKASRIPSLNANTFFYESFGRQIDPTTNSFNSQSFGNQSYNLNSRVTIFNFNKINNSIKQSKLNLLASEADKEQNIRDIALQVAQAYLIVLIAKENLQVAEKSLEQTNEQLKVTDLLIDAGSKNRNSRLEIVAQQAKNESQVISAQNDIAIGLLNLKQTINIDPGLNIDIVIPSVPVPMENPDSLDYETLVASAFKTQPQFESFDSKIHSALLGEKTAKSQGLPSITMQGSASTTYSTLSRQITGTELQRQQIPGAQLNNEAVNFSFLNPVVTTGKNPYFTQLNQNLGFGLGIGIDIPIFNGLQVKTNVQQARLNKENIQLLSNQARQQLRSDVLKSLTDARAARLNLYSAQKAFEAQSGAYSDTKKRYEIGTANSFELITSKNNLDTVERDLIISRYDYTFKMKVLDYYAGKQISFN